MIRIISKYSKFDFSIINKIRGREKTKNKIRHPPEQRIKLKPYQFHDKFNVPNQQEISQKREELTPYQLYLIDSKSLQRPFTGNLWGEISPGFYHCVICDTRLFSFDQKIHHKNQATGFPGFYDCVEKRVEVVQQKVNFDLVNLPTNDPFLQKAIEQHKRCQCRQCKMHLGALFFDGPYPTFLRLSVNSALLKFVDLPDFQDPTFEKRRRVKIYQKLRQKTYLK